MTSHALSNDLSVADINQFVDRWSRTLDYFAAGIYYSTKVPTGLSTDFIAFDLQKRHLNLAHEAIDEAAERGYADMFVELADAVQQLRAFVFQPSGGVCAQVRLRIDQEAVIARDAFRASLDIVNGSSTTLSNIAALGDLWQLWENVVPVAPMTPFPAHTNLSPVFYRAIRNPTGP